jgi:hypothetical protein
MSRHRHRRPQHAPHAAIAGHENGLVNRKIGRIARARHTSKRALEEGAKAAAEAFTVEITIFVIVRVCMSVGAVGVAGLLFAGKH